jgi:hypothetical protein
LGLAKGLAVGACGSASVIAVMHHTVVDPFVLGRRPKWGPGNEPGGSNEKKEDDQRPIAGPERLRWAPGNFRLNGPKSCVHVFT